MAPPVSHLASTRYALVIDAGSSGSRLQIYSWQDPEAEREGIVSAIKERWRKQGKSMSRKGKGKADAADEMEWEVERALRRLVKVEKGAPGDLWIKKAEPGMHNRKKSTVTILNSLHSRHINTRAESGLGLPRTSPYACLATNTTIPTCQYSHISTRDCRHATAPTRSPTGASQSYMQTTTETIPISCGRSE